MTRPSSNPGRELALVLTLTVLGAGLRLWDAGRLGLQHFDEGIYASSGSWIFAREGLRAIGPHVIAYAPPGMPILVGLSYLILGPSDLSAIAVDLVAGIVSVPAGAWLGRRTIGPGAGAATAALIALSAPHVAFSRAALTDVPFLLAWLACMGSGGRFLESPRLGRALALGLAVGLAQNFKYNGWLAGVVVAIAAGTGPGFGRRGRSGETARTIGFGLVAASVAALVYWPWFLFVEEQVGYRSLLAHHRSYFGGVDSWWPHWRSQLAQSVALSGGPSWGSAAWGAAWIGATLASFPAGQRASTVVRRPWRVVCGLAGGLIAYGFLPNLSWWAGLVSLPWLLRDPRPAVRIVGSWFLVLTILTPFYHPYARLWLPLVSAGWLIAARLVVEVTPAWGPSSAPESGGPMEGRGALIRLGPAGRVSVVGVLLVLASFDQFGGPRRARALPGILGPRDSIRAALSSSEFLRDHGRRPIDSGERIRTLVRPSVAFYLGRRVVIQPQSSLGQFLREGRPGEWGMVDEVLLRQEGDVKTHRDRLRSGGWETVSARAVPLDPVTRLDVDPGAAFDGHPADPPSLVLVRRKLSGAGP